MPSIIADEEGLAASYRTQYKERRFFDANETHAGRTGGFTFGFDIPHIIEASASGHTTIGLVMAARVWRLDEGNADAPSERPSIACYSPGRFGRIGGWFRSTQYSPSCRMASVNCSKSTGFTM
jgi:hypothetical protein